MNAKIEEIYSHWDAIDEEEKRHIFNAFKLKYNGCYKRRDLLNFLELRLMAECDLVSADRG